MGRSAPSSPPELERAEGPPAEFACAASAGPAWGRGGAPVSVGCTGGHDRGAARGDSGQAKWLTWTIRATVWPGELPVHRDGIRAALGPEVDLDALAVERARDVRSHVDEARDAVAVVDAAALAGLD